MIERKIFVFVVQSGRKNMFLVDRQTICIHENNSTVVVESEMAIDESNCTRSNYINSL
jgi:hypothetical protein